LTQLGWIGVWLLVVSVLAIVFEGVIAAVWSRRVAVRAIALSERLATERAVLQADVERLQAGLAEMRMLWQPYRRVLRWLRHPLVLALLQSYARHRTAAP
jgi:hypothetical protein